MSSQSKPTQEALPFPSQGARSAMAEFEQILLSNSGEDAFETAVKLLAAKLFDELHAPPAAQARFRIHETAEETLNVITELYVKAVERWPLLHPGTTELGISAPHLVRAMRPLLGWNLHGSDLTWLDATLERLVARDSKGALGQYFTPREIVSLCVEIANPRPSDIIIDPACGSGGFLFEAISHASKASKGMPRCLGIDFSPKSVKVATLLAAAIDESGITISKANSIDGRAYQAHTPSEWHDFLTQEKASSTPRAETWGAWNHLGADLILTNPPFAGDIDDYALLEAYEAQLDRSSKKAVSREHLFLERAVDLLRPGGRLAIVVPQGILANPTAKYLRSWLLKKCRVIAVVGLHQNAFTPYTSVKTAIVFLAKPAIGETLPADYPVLFAISRNCGKDSSGKNTEPTDYPGIAAAIKNFTRQQGFKWAAKEAADSHHNEVEIVPISEVVAKGRLDAEHYDPAIRSLERRLASITQQKIGHMVESRVTRFKRPLYKDISYVDISSVDNRTGLTFPETISAPEAPSRASYLIEKGDVLVSTVRPDRNVVALITEDKPVPTIASNGFCVLRSKTLPSELLFAYCKTQAFKNILSMHAAASMYPTVSEKDVLNIPFVRPPEHVENRVINLVRSGMEKIAQAQKEIQEAITLMDKAVSGEEAASDENS